MVFLKELLKKTWLWKISLDDKKYEQFLQGGKELSEEQEYVFHLMA